MRLYGFLGGVGPKASATFLNALYAHHAHITSEQELPKLIMLSDPTIPDRTSLLLNGHGDVLYAALCKRLDIINKMDVDKIFILCFTLHYFIKEIKEQYANIVSIVDLGLQAVLQHKKKVLLLCSNGTHRLGVFQKSVLWRRVRQYIRIPEGQYQEAVHRIIYTVKVGNDDHTVPEQLNRIVRHYGVECAVAGCTELHVVAQHWGEHSLLNFTMIDPMHLVIQYIYQDMLQGQLAELGSGHVPDVVGTY